MDVRFCTWNLRNPYRAGLFMTVTKEISKIKLDIVGVLEVRWDWWHRTSRRIYVFLGERESES
jgi:hypothetical protein